MQKGSNKLIAVSSFFILLFIFAKWGPAINFSTTTQTKGEPLVVSGEGKVYVTPDIAKITLGIQENGISLKTLQESVNKKSAALVSAIEKNGVKKEDIKTTSYNLYPQYDYQNSPNKINGYQIMTSYEVTIRDFDKINELVSIATSVGANMEGGITFDINDATKKEKINEARKLAVDDAKAKAQGLSAAAGVSLGKIINISENTNSNEIRPIALFTAGSPSDQVTSKSSIEAGQTEIKINISLSYEIR